LLLTVLPVALLFLDNKLLGERVLTLLPRQLLWRECLPHLVPQLLDLLGREINRVFRRVELDRIGHEKLHVLVDLDSLVVVPVGEPVLDVIQIDRVLDHRGVVWDSGDDLLDRVQERAEGVKVLGLERLELFHRPLQLRIIATLGLSPSTVGIRQILGRRRMDLAFRARVG
jgi:hypothetical protein